MEIADHQDNLNVFDALGKVKDRETFVAFVQALVKEREQAEGLERENPEYYAWGAPLGWQNSSISAYLSAALAGVEDSEAVGRLILKEPSWRILAEFLYMGKIYE